MKRRDNTSSDDFDDDFEEQNNRPQIQRGLSAVAALPGRNVLVIILFFLLLAITVYYSFFSSDDQKSATQEQASEISKKVETTKPVGPELAETSVPTVPALPEPPPLVIPTPPAPPPPPPAPPPSPLSTLPPPAGTPAATAVVPPSNLREEQELRDALAQRKRSQIMLGGGGGGAAAGASLGVEAEGKDGKKSAKSLIDFGNSNFSPAQTSSDQQRATKIGVTSTIVAQGKIIDAVLETAINTDLDGVLRAVVSRDVYAESGKNVLIPKGSRLIGKYKSNVKRGQRRVDIIWARVIRPDGIDIQVDSLATDQLGRAGVEGLVDNKYFELFANSILISTVTTAVAIAADKLADGGQVTNNVTNNNNGTSTSSQTGSSSSLAINDAVQTLGSVARGVLQEAIQVQPTITIDQGTRVKVFVNRDLIFPSDISSQVRFVQ